ncbi:uncharacterized protein LOC62_03G004503 [Vanrija pseudolonga]|uniref:Uncharacterized protein n=1 Tax=Vanrija pseudolonga TaxID=143232 RepID=A0AAF0YA44_9TREE|nr:hypothetical protein LOC62_03G004503 [Vanrija pseudolonga]
MVVIQLRPPPLPNTPSKRADSVMPSLEEDFNHIALHGQKLATAQAEFAAALTSFSRNKSLSEVPEEAPTWLASLKQELGEQVAASNAASAAATAAANAATAAANAATAAANAATTASNEAKNSVKTLMTVANTLEKAVANGRLDHAVATRWAIARVANGRSKAGEHPLVPLERRPQLPETFVVDAPLPALLHAPRGFPTTLSAAWGLDDDSIIRLLDAYAQVLEATPVQRRNQFFSFIGV